MHQYVMYDGGLCGQPSFQLKPIVRWLWVIFRPDVYRVEESMKLSTMNPFGVRNKFSLGAT